LRGVGAHGAGEARHLQIGLFILRGCGELRRDECNGKKYRFHDLIGLNK
jgi:hypothetical protein